MVKSIWKYLTLGLFVLLLGVFTVSMFTQNKLKDRIIECEANSKPDIEYVYLTDTVEVNKVQTKYKTVKEYVHDTTLLYEVDSTIIEVPVHDTFYLPVEHNVYTSTLDTAGFHMKADIHYSGIEPKLDSINYDVVIEHKKKPCCWLKKIFCGCE